MKLDAVQWQALKTSGNPARVGPEHTFPASLEDYCARGQDVFGLEVTRYHAAALSMSVLPPHAGCITIGTL